MALPLFLAAAGPGQAGETPAAPLPPPPASEAAKSAGLLNDALREASPAWEKWDVGGQARFRYDLKHNGGMSPNADFLPGGADNDNDFFLFRQKLHLGWQPESWLKFFVQGRGAQVASDGRDPSPDEDVADLQQAYIQLGDAKLFPLTLKVGRQELIYGDQRFIGNGDWGNTGRVFDAASLRYSFSEKSWIDLFSGRVVIPRDGHFNESNEHDHFSGLYASSQDLWPGVETQAFFLSRNVGGQSPNAIAPGIGGPSERDVYTYGLRLKSLPGAFGGWDFYFEGAGQFGEIVSGGAARDLRSYFFAGSVGHTFEEAWAHPRIGLGYDYASGDSSAADGRHETFDPLFGTNHNYYGVMDLIGPRNLNSPRVSLSFKPLKKLSVAADYLLVWLADASDSFYPEAGSARNANGYGRNPQFDSFVGSELDIVVKYALTPWAEIHAGYGHFFVGDYVKQSVRNPEDADWFYVQTTINF